MSQITQAKGRAAQDRRDAIIQRAAELFDDAGYHNTSVEEIATAVGLRKPTLYHYFKSKDEILLAIHDEFIELLLSRHDSRLKVPMSSKQRLVEVMADVLELMETHRGHVRVFFEHHRELAADKREVIREKRDAYQTQVQEEISRAIEEGSIRSVDPRLATLAIFGMCNWSYQWYRAGGPLGTREIAYTFADMLFVGLAAPDAKS